MSYYFSTRIDGTFAEALDRTRAALKAEGFGIVSEINIQKTLKEKIGVEFRPYTILGACNPALAHEALKLEDKVGTMLPCNVIVQEIGEENEVAAIDPVASMQAIPNAELHEKAGEVAGKLRAVIASLGPEQGAGQADGLMSEIEAHAAESRREMDSFVPTGTDPLHEGP
ncbi:MAG TPA: DUF302 domain-containing protein [Sphingomicrobium sp.]|jgi:uncharacterized protein (DUF302 family)|nr:DUF302 domain-containing protein [Sphingomicrobium sp.]